MIFYLDAIADLKSEKEVILTYLKKKIEVADWHGVADAAMDLREIEAKIFIWMQVGKSI